MGTGILVALGILVFIGILFSADKRKDNQDLKDNPLEKRYSDLIERLNYHAFSGKGVVTVMSKTDLNLYQTGRNQIIQINYFNEGLTIIWKYKYLQEEVVYEKRVKDIKNLDSANQTALANFINNEMINIVADHQDNVIKKKYL